MKELFQAALERLPAERAAFLDRACAGDPELRSELESLLASHEEAGTFLEAPAVEAGPGGAALSAGARLGPYEIMELLGMGGMGEVYRARDTRLGREVAVKLLPPALAESSERLSRFDQEARAASALSHPNIVTVYDVGRDEGLVYFVTELLQGETLAARLTHGALAVRKALDCAVQVARGLAAAHERGIVHRDLKPANLFLTTQGQVKILDFGLAKLADRRVGSPSLGAGASAATTPGLAMGTVGYMSPEQVRAERVDFRSDQFSFGCLLYELLTGRAPFRRPTAAQTLAAVLEDEPAAIPTLNPRVPPPVAWIVERCLAKDVEDRYADTRDLARDLETTASRLPELSGMPAASGVSVWHRRRRLYLRVAWAAALVALGAGAWWWYARPTAAVPIVRPLTYSGRDSSPAASPDGKLVAFSSSRDGRRRIWIKQLATGSELPLTEGEDEHPRFSPDGSLLLFARRADARVALYRTPLLGGEARKVIDGALYGDFAPDGRRICFVRQFVADGQMTSLVGTAALDGSAVRELGSFRAALVHPRWSPDGKTVAVTETALQIAEPTAIVLLDADTGKARRLVPPSAAGIWPGGLVWAGHRRVLYSQPESVVGVQSGSGSRIVLQDLGSPEAREVLWHPATVLVIDVLAPGRVVFEARSLRQNLREFPLRPGEPPSPGRWLTRGNSADRQPIYTPDGEWVVISSNRAGRLDLWAVSRHTGAVRRLTDDEAEDWDPGFTPDGKLLWSSNRTGHFEVWLGEADGTGGRQVSSDGVGAQNPVATPDGQWILYASSNPRSRGILKVRTDGSQATLLVPGNMVLPEVSPDGKHVAFVADLGSERAVLRVARIADGALTRFAVPLPPWIPGGSIDLGRCRWFPDGRALAFIGRAPDGTYGVYAQDFLAASDTSSTRRWLVPPDPERSAETLAISPDGSHLTVAYWDQQFNLMVAENIRGIQPPRRAARTD